MTTSQLDSDNSSVKVSSFQMILGFWSSDCTINSHPTGLNADKSLKVSLKSEGMITDLQN